MAALQVGISAIGGVRTSFCFTWERRKRPHKYMDHGAFPSFSSAVHPSFPRPIPWINRALLTLGYREAQKGVNHFPGNNVPIPAVLPGNGIPWNSRGWVKVGAAPSMSQLPASPRSCWECASPFSLPGENSPQPRNGCLGRRPGLGTGNLPPRPGADRGSQPCFCPSQVSQEAREAPMAEPGPRHRPRRRCRGKKGDFGAEWVKRRREEEVCAEH